MAAEHRDEIRTLVDRVRVRWRRLVLLKVLVRAGLATALLSGIAIAAAGAAADSVLWLGVVGATFIALEAGALMWLLRPAFENPTDGRVARFIEEREPQLDDRLASAVAFVQDHREPSGAFVQPVLEDAARWAGSLDPAAIVPTRALKRAGGQATAVLLLGLSVAYGGRGVLQRAVTALTPGLFETVASLQVTPGDARLRAGEPLAIEAQLEGPASAPARLMYLTGEAPDLAGGDVSESDWVAAEMTAGAAGAFTFSFEAVHAAFRYRVEAGGLRSPVYQVAVTRAPRVTSIDLEYVFPPPLGLEPRTEIDSGDIYAPAGTNVRLRVHTDIPAAGGRLNLSGGATIALGTGDVLSGTLTVVEDTSYRVALTDEEGRIDAGDTEYFIRILNDRPPDIRVTRPARDRDVTPLEEVEVEAEARDDFGLERMELVYSVGGGTEQAVPLPLTPGAKAVSAAHTLFLEDLGVRPGDFVSYYVRARDVARGARASEARSDIFFLQVRPFDREFTLVDSQGMGGGTDRSLGDLVTAQKQIIVATWKLDRRSDVAGAQSESDIRAVARAEAELKRRVEETASSLGTSSMRDPRQGPTVGPPAGTSGASSRRPEEAAMAAAAAAMGRAVTSLENLRTDAALPAEMDALNALLEAQADLKRQEVPRQQEGRGGSDRSTPDLSGLFDEELQRDQQTSVEMPPPPEEQEDTRDDTVDRVRELARRQEGLLRRQQELEQKEAGMTEEDLKKAIEELSAEQTELRREAEQMAKEMAGGERKPEEGSQPGSEGQPGSQSSGQAGPSGQQGRPGPQGQIGQQGQMASTPSDQGVQQMEAVSEDMRGAVAELGRRDAGQAAERGARALERLREVEDRLRSATPDEQRRALGDMQLEARQLADEQRQLGSDLRAEATGEALKDAMRRLAAEQDRLADRAQGLADDLTRQGGRNQSPTDGSESARDLRRAADEAAREIDRQRIVERMTDSAERLREAGAAGGETPSAGERASAARTQEEVARSLERLADQLAAATGPGDPESRTLTDQLARAQELRDRMETATQELERLDQEAREGGDPANQGPTGEAGAGPSLEKVREELRQQLQETRALLEQIRREDPEFTPGAGSGATFEGQNMVFSAPGTEAFKQDFERWEILRAQTTEALERAGLSVSARLNARESRDRLAAGVDDRVPPEYQDYVDSYFKALAGRKAP